MHRDESAEPVVDGMAKRKQARLSEQHVEGEREDGVDADLAEEREPVALVQREWPDHQQGQVGAPENEAPRVQERRRLHVSRAPISPRGRKMRIATMSR